MLCFLVLGNQYCFLFNRGDFFTMTNYDIKKVLIDKGVTQLYHANTVSTACTFIENNGLISRGAVRDLGLYQTEQKSDKIDQVFDVYYDIFFDSVDIHQRTQRINFYGPVLFVYSIDLLDTLESENIRITRSNPQYWNMDMSDEDKYFSNIDQLRCFYSYGNFGQHLTIRHQITPLSFEFLDKIILDNPKFEDNVLFDRAYKYLEYLLKKNDYDIPFEVRECSSLCKCHTIYDESWDNEKKFGIKNWREVNL